MDTAIARLALALSTATRRRRVNPDLVARDGEGKPYTVRYEAVNAMLLNEFLKEHRKVEQQANINQQQETTIAELKSEIRALTKRFEEQSAQIQKVSEQVQLNAHVPRLALNEP